MADSIFIRVQRVVSAGVESVVEVAERASGTALMREAIREVERTIDRVQRDTDAATTRRIHADHQQKSIRDQLATLGEQARFAVEKGREDLAEVALARQIDLEAQSIRLRTLRSDAVEEEAKLRNTLTALDARRLQMEKEFAAFQSAQRAAAADASVPGGSGRSASRRMARAEAAFERAMAAAGGVIAAGHSADAAVKLAEIDSAQKEAAVAERLAALRSDKPGPKRASAKRR